MSFIEEDFRRQVVEFTRSVDWNKQVKASISNRTFETCAECEVVSKIIISNPVRRQICILFLYDFSIEIKHILSKEQMLLKILKMFASFDLTSMQNTAGTSRFNCYYRAQRRVSHL
jgi:hypothetical protein